MAIELCLSDHCIPPFQVEGRSPPLFMTWQRCKKDRQFYLKEFHFRTADGSPTVNGCNGAVSAIYPMWFKDIAGGHGVHERNVPYQGRVGSCDPSTPKWNSGAKVTNTVYAQGSQCNRDYLKNAIAQYGHALIGVFASEQQFKDYESGVLETCRYFWSK